MQESLGNIYTADNVVLSATHTHSGPAGYMQYILFEVTSLGFVEQTFQALVDGISRSILLGMFSNKIPKITIFGQMYFNEKFKKKRYFHEKSIAQSCCLIY